LIYMETAHETTPKINPMQNNLYPIILPPD